MESASFQLKASAEIRGRRKRRRRKKKKKTGGEKDRNKGRERGRRIKILTGCYLDSGGWRVCTCAEHDKD